MKRFTITVILCLLGYLLSTSSTIANKRGLENNWIKINWTNEVEGDFSFTNKWSYQEGVYWNQFGQLSCDGMCPMEIDQMKDDEGRIYQDSLTSFYEIIDTSHLMHSIKSEAWAYEWGETNFISFQINSNGSILGMTDMNIATHSSLSIQIQNDSVKAWIDFSSIRTLEDHTFLMTEGEINLDRDSFNNGIIKAEFDFKFENHLETEKEIFWKGLIYSRFTA